MGRTTRPLPGRPMPIHSLAESQSTNNTRSTSPVSSGENGANSQRPLNVIIPSIPGGSEDALREHRNRLLEETSTGHENIEPEGQNQISLNFETIENQFKQLQEQNRQILAALQENQQTRDKSRTKITVSKAIASEVRLVAKKLRERIESPLIWDFTKAFRDDVNEQINHSIRERVRNVHPNVSAVELEAALKSHFLTRRKRSRRERAGGLERHQKNQRKTQRKQNLLRSRSKAIDISTALTPAEKAKIKSIMKLDYMSSEESMSEEEDINDNRDNNVAGSDSDSEGGPPKQRKVLIKHPLPWRSPLANQYVESLDRKAKRRLSERSLTMLLKRKIGEPSRRPRPTGGPEWALRA